MTGNFTDRERDLASLDRLRVSQRGTSPQLLVVSGPAGVGKTALTSMWLRKVAEDFPDGCLYADLRGHDVGGPAAPGDVLGTFLRSLYAGPVPAALADQTALWRSVTAGLHIAVMLDNAFTAAQVRSLLPGGESNGLVVVTSRQRLTGLRADGAAFHTLGFLDAEAAAELLSRGVGKERVRKEAAAARQVVALCAGSPLAVCLASARLASRPRQPVRAMADALGREQERLAALRVEGEAVVRSALDESCSVLPAEAVTLYGRLGLLPTLTLDSWVAAAVGDLSHAAAEELLDVLVEANLIEDIGPDTYKFHDLVRLHARERGQAQDTDSTRVDAQRRACEWYLRAATQAEELLTPHQLHLSRDYWSPVGLAARFEGEADALVWLDSQRFNLMSTVRAAVEHGWDDMVWQLVDAMWPLFLRLRYYDQWIEAHELGLAAARRAGRKAAGRQMLLSGAIGLSAARKINDAVDWYTQSLTAAREAEDPRDEGQALLGLGSTHREAGRLRDAEGPLRQAIETWQAVGYLRGTALARVVLGDIALESEDFRAAVDHLTQAYATMTTVHDPHDEARALAFLGFAHFRAGARETGLAELDRALSVFEHAGSAHWQARTLEMLGMCSEDQDDIPTAREHYEQSAALFAHISRDDAHRLRDRLDSLSPPAGR